MAVVALSVIEQRYRAVMAVLDGASVSEVAAEVGVSRQSVHAWVRRYRAAGLAGWRIGRTGRCRVRIAPSAELEAVVCELRRAHPKWGALRILHELMRGPAPPERLPSRSTVQPHPGPPRAGDRARAAAQALGLRALAAAGGDGAVAAGHPLSARGWSTR